MGKWLTPDLPTGVLTCRQFLIPTVLLPAFDGALGMLTIPEAWETFGEMTPDDAAQTLYDVILQSYDRGCGMIGSIMIGAWETLPENLLECDGATYARVDYPLLYAVLDGHYVDDEDYFHVPDMRSRMVIGAGEGEDLSEYDIGDTGGEETHALSIDEMPEHTHSVLEAGLNVDVEPPAGLPDAAGGLPLPSTTGSAGSGIEHENMPPYIAMTFAIVAR